MEIFVNPKKRKTNRKHILAISYIYEYHSAFGNIQCQKTTLNNIFFFSRINLKRVYYVCICLNNVCLVYRYTRTYLHSYSSNIFIVRRRRRRRNTLAIFASKRKPYVPGAYNVAFTCNAFPFMPKRYILCG